MLLNLKICAFFLVLLALEASAGHAAEPALGNLKKIPKSKVQKEFLTQEWGRDPFSLTEKKEAGHGFGSSIQLMGILTRGDKKIAIIDKVFVRAGESVQGYAVTAIENDRVILNRDGEETVLRIAEHEKKS